MRTLLRPATWSIRARITLAATVVVGIVLGAGSFALVRLQVQTLDRSIDAGLAIRADDIEGAIAAGTLADVLSVGDDEIAAIQVVRPDGEVVATSANLAGAAPMVRHAPNTHQSVEVVPGLPFEDEPFRVLQRTVPGPEGPYAVLVAGSRDDALESAAALATALWIATPLVTAAAAAGTWFLVGRSLAPVEAMRREVAEINETALDRRVQALGRADEISSLARTMNQMLDRLEAAYVRQREFVDDAAHELRTPLATLRAEVESGTVEGEPLLRQIVRLQSLIDDLLVLAADRASANGVVRTVIDLDDIILEEVRLARATSPVVIDASRVSGGAVRGDAGQLARVVRNLLENAVHHAQASVKVGLEEGAGTVTFTVVDDGPGIAPADREKIFERFTRLDYSRARHLGGSGLGLAIVRSVVQSHGGTVRVEEAASGGAAFVIELAGAGFDAAGPRQPGTDAAVLRATPPP